MAGMIERADLSPSMRELLEELLRAFDFFNQRHWGGRLVRPVFGFHPNPPNGRTLGHYWAGRWVDGERRGDEIVFYADLCLKAGMKQVLQTLLHEMVHLWQQMFGDPGKNNYHNKEWHKEAARVGLVTDPKDRVGYTKPGEGFERALVEFKPRVERIPFRLGAGLPSLPPPGPGGGDDDDEGGEGGGGAEPPTKGKQRKWTCGCGFGVRVAKTRDGQPYFNATCGDCGERFKLAE